MNESLCLNGKMGDINRALHEQKKQYGGSTTVETWIKMVKIFPQVSQELVADLTEGKR